MRASPNVLGRTIHQHRRTIRRVACMPRSGEVLLPEDLPCEAFESPEDQPENKLHCPSPPVVWPHQSTSEIQQKNPANSASRKKPPAARARGSDESPKSFGLSLCVNQFTKIFVDLGWSSGQVSKCALDCTYSSAAGNFHARILCSRLQHRNRPLYAGSI